MFTGPFLSEMRRKAIRKGVWFKALDNVERGILSLTARLVDRVESAVLGVELVKILNKLRDALKSGFVKQMEAFGFKRARELAKLALQWGYGAAQVWASDLCYVRYLTLIEMNQPTGFNV